MPTKSPIKFPWPGSTHTGVGFAPLRKGWGCDQGVSLVVIVLKLVFSCPPTPFTAVMMAIANAGGDQAVFDGGSARLVSKKLLENAFQLCLPLSLS